MGLSPEERERIYLEEKIRREGSGMSSLSIILLSIVSLLGIVGIFYLSEKLEEKQVSLDDLRKAYPGLTPEEEEELKSAS